MKVVEPNGLESSLATKCFHSCENLEILPGIIDYWVGHELLQSLPIGPVRLHSYPDPSIQTVLPGPCPEGNSRWVKGFRKPVDRAIRSDSNGFKYR